MMTTEALSVPLPAELPVLVASFTITWLRGKQGVVAVVHRESSVAPADFIDSIWPLGLSGWQYWVFGHGEVAAL